MFQSIKSLKPVELLLAVLFLLAPLYYHSNIGGLGLRIPANIVIWLTALIFIGYAVKYTSDRRQLVLPENYLGLLLFPFAVFISLFLYSEYESDYLFRVTVILGGTFFFIALFQFRFKRLTRDRVLFFIVLSATIQSLIAILQMEGFSSIGSLFAASAGVPTGTFQQVNNMAIFQVIAIIASLYLIKRPKFKSLLHPQNIFIYVAVAVASYVITSSGSRVSILSLVISFVLVIPSIVIGFKQNRSKYLSILVMSFVGISFGLQSAGFDKLEQKTMDLKSEYSGAARVAIYEISFELIKQKPWFGVGPSQFAKAWHEEKINYQKENPHAAAINSYVVHPHNEILFWLVETGVLVTLTFIIFGLTILTYIYKKTLASSLSYLAMLTPIAIHTQVELPFYTSALLYFVFLYLLLQLSSVKTMSKDIEFKGIIFKVINLGLFSVLVISILFLTHSLKSSYEFKQFYNQRDLNAFDSAVVNPFFKDDYQWLFYRTVAFAVINGGRIDSHVLDELIAWYKMKLIDRPDRNLFGDMIQLQAIAKERQAACLTLDNAFDYYPNNSFIEDLNSHIKCQ